MTNDNKMIQNEEISSESASNQETEKKTSIGKIIFDVVKFIVLLIVFLLIVTGSLDELFYKLGMGGKPGNETMFGSTGKVDQQGNTLFKEDDDEWNYPEKNSGGSNNGNGKEVTSVETEAVEGSESAGEEVVESEEVSAEETVESKEVPTEEVVESEEVSTEETVESKEVPTETVENSEGETETAASNETATETQITDIEFAMILPVNFIREELGGNVEEWGTITIDDVIYNAYAAYKDVSTDYSHLYAINREKEIIYWSLEGEFWNVLYDNSSENKRYYSTESGDYFLRIEPNEAVEDYYDFCVYGVKGVYTWNCKLPNESKEVKYFNGRSVVEFSYTSLEGTFYYDLAADSINWNNGNKWLSGEKNQEIVFERFKK